MAQSSVLLIPREELVDNIGMYAGIDNVKFKHSVYPGDTVCVKARALGRKGPLVLVEAKATVNDKIACQGKLSFMLVPKDKLNLK